MIADLNPIPDSFLHNFLLFLVGDLFVFLEGEDGVLFLQDGVGWRI
jgi:hypothetical protein